MEIDGDGRFGDRDLGAAGSSTGDQGNSKSDSGARGTGADGDGSSTFAGPAPGAISGRPVIRVDQGEYVVPSGAPIGPPRLCSSLGTGSSGIYCSTTRAAETALAFAPRAIELTIAVAPGAILGAIGGALSGPPGAMGGRIVGGVLGGLTGGLPGARSTADPRDDMIRSGADADSSMERRTAGRDPSAPPPSWTKSSF